MKKEGESFIVVGLDFKMKQFKNKLLKKIDKKSNVFDFDETFTNFDKLD
jgi:hypothetical protein